jgi:hypothetical protein
MAPESRGVFPGKTNLGEGIVQLTSTLIFESLKIFYSKVGLLNT